MCRRYRRSGDRVGIVIVLRRRVEIASEDCLENGTCIRFVPGTADFGSTKPYYIGAADCGFDDPFNADAITGFAVPPLLMRVNATCDSVGDGGVPDVPAVGIAGALILLLVMLGMGYHVMR